MKNIVPLGGEKWCRTLKTSVFGGTNVTGLVILREIGGRSVKKLGKKLKKLGALDGKNVVGQV